MSTYRANGVDVLMETDDPEIESKIVDRVCVARTTVLAARIAQALNDAEEYIR